jgi:N-dimethylarginine dimethylaminohydrolase
MKTPKATINRNVLMSDPNHFSAKELNPYSFEEIQPNIEAAKREHRMVRAAIGRAGINVYTVQSPEGCQDGVYTANWAFCSGEIAIMSHLPNIRRAEEPYARKILHNMGKYTLTPPARFSGQGDALVAGDRLFLGGHYRTDAARMEDFLEDVLDYDIVGVQTIPQLDEAGQPVINKVSGWPDSFFYDIDLAMGVVKPDLIAYCPEAFLPESAEKIRAVPGIRKIEVSREEAMGAFACNFISSGHTVVMGDNAPRLKADIESYGVKTITLNTPELVKGGGFIRCTSLTLDNQ